MKIRKSCYSAEKILLYAAGEMEPREVTSVRAHLAACAGCASLAEELSETGELVEAVLATAIEAPPTLDARVMATLRALPPRRLRWPSFVPPWNWQQRLTTATAAACLLLAGSLFGGWYVNRAELNPSSIATSSQSTLHEPQMLNLVDLRADHLRSLTDPAAVSVPGSVPREVTAKLAKHNSEAPAPVPVDLSAAGAKLIGGCWHVVDGQTLAFLCYEWNGRRVSLYQTDKQRLTVPGLQAMTERQDKTGSHQYVVQQDSDLTYVAWRSGATNYILVAQEAPDRVLHLAQRAAITGRNA